jgi:hypothetical protein
MNGDGVFDEQTDFSFLGLEEQAPASKKQSKQRKDRSVQVGDICIDIRLTFRHSEEAKAKISAGNSGRKHSEETKAKLRKAKKAGAKPKQPAQRMSQDGKRWIGVVTPAGFFASTKEAAKHYQVGPKTIRVRTRRFPTEFYYVITEVSAEERERRRAKKSASAKGHTMSEENKAKLSARRKGVPMTAAALEKMRATKAAKARPFMTPLGPVLTKREAAKIFGVDNNTIRVWELNYPQHFYYITKD